jgi:hypothetical protein
MKGLILILKSYFLLLECLWNYLLEKKNKKAYSYEWLMRKHLFTLNQTANQDLLIVLKVYYWTINLIFRKYNKDCIQSISGGNPEYASHLYFKHFDDNILNEYFREHFPEYPSLALYRGQISLKGDFLFKITLFFYCSLHMLFMSPITFISRNRGYYAMNILEVCEVVILTRLLSRQGIKHLYYHGPFNRESNLASLLLEKEGILSYKVPSIAPLKIFYRNVVSHSFFLIGAQHEEEYDSLMKNEWLVDNVERMPCFNHKELESIMIENQALPKAEKGSLAFISRGIWRREQLGLQESEYLEMKSEKVLLTLLKEYLNKRGIDEINILCHPIEKRTDELFKETHAYYSDFFGDIEVILGEPEKTSYQLFNQFDVIVSGYSSTNIDCLFMGGKVVYSFIGMTENLFEKTNLSNVVAMDPTQLFELLDNVREIDEDTYFSSFHLEKYRNRK